MNVVEKEFLCERSFVQANLIFQDLQFSFIIDYYAISYVFSFARILTIPWLQFYLLFITQPK